MRMMRSAVVVLALVALAACSESGGQSSKAPTLPRYAAGPRDINIAVVGPLTGGNDVFGKQMLRGVSTAVSEVNAQGGLLGKHIVTVIGDDDCSSDTDKIEGVANDVVRELVVFVVGHFCSASSLAAARIYQRNGVIMMTPASSNPALTEAGRPYIFRMFFTDDFQALIAAQYIAHEYPGFRIGVVDDGSSYGHSLAERMQAELAQRQIEVVLTQQIAPGEAAYPVLIDAVAAKGVDLLYYGGYHTEAAAIAAGLHQRGLKTILFGGDGLLTSEYGRLAGPAAEGTLITASPDLTTLPPAQPVVARLRDSTQDPEGYTLYAYAAVQAWAQAVRSAGSINANAVSEALHGNSFATVLGKVTFDEKGDLADPPIVIKKWTGGAYQQVWPQAGS